jgi:type I site-specific restriction endonuclease
MNNLLKTAGKAIGYLGGGLTLITFAQGVKSNNQNKIIIESLKKRIELQEDLISKYEGQIKKDLDYTKLSSRITDINEETDKALRENDKLAEISNNLNNSNLDTSQIEFINKDISYHINNLENYLSSSNSKLEELKNIVKDIFGSGPSSSTNYLGKDTFDNLQVYLSSLPIEKVGALGHILISLAILLSVLSLISVFYGDSLIKYYNLETKFPKLAKFIQLRRKFQQYYFTLNISLIVTALLLIIYVNLIVFFN